tara:strand:+ start:88 stop:420 length:333 start_codon:yes stop_codon:yes gene_type:complete
MSKKLTIKNRDEIIKVARKVKTFCKSGLDISKGIYKNNDELIADAIYISNYGEISSVRKAIKLVEEVLDLKIPLQIPEDIKKDLDEKEKLKKDQTPRFQVKYGKYYVSFD